MAWRGDRRFRVPTLAVGAILLCAAFAAVAFATSQRSHGAPVVSLTAPGEVTSGAGFVAVGRVATEASGQVVVQVNRGRGWQTIGHGHVRGHRFRVDCSLAGEGGVSLRATFGAGTSSPLHSASRHLSILAAAPPASSPASASATPPPATSSPPSTATTQVAPPAEEAAPIEPEAPPTIAGDYWGAWFDGNPSPEDIAARQRFERLAGKPLSILEAYSSWGSCSSTCAPNQPFPTALFEKIRTYGAIPMYSWASEANGSANEPEYKLSEIARGRYDAYIEGWAKEAKAWGRPFFLRFDWEMNGNWFPWGEGVNGNVAGDYVAAWRHVHEIFTRVGATNVSWVWCPFANPGGNLPATTSFYPGDEYVDWTAIDGYNRGTSSSGSHWRTFAEVFGPDYDAITALAPSKPMLLPEVASSESGGSKAAWIDEMFAQLPSAFPDVRGFLWFDHEEDGHGWPIESSASATEAFAAGVADPRYLTNSLGSLPDGPVPVPTG